MDFRDVLLVLHIAGAGTWLGANIIQGVVPTLSARQGVAVVAGWYRVAAQLSKKVYMPASIVILLTGIGLVLQNESFGFGTLFVIIGFGMLVVGALLAIFFIDAAAEGAADAVETGEHQAVRAAAGRLATFGTIDTLLLLLTITAMVLRLGV